MNPQKKFNLVFSILMGGSVAFIMTAIITFINVGLVSNFIFLWMKAWGFAFVCVVPIVFFLAPQMRKITARILDMPL